ncbi:MAG: PQQ-binding-like beta-propeller repeat protein [Planctomycetes bacterium]|nr:PQQ-binding-like beta-propeller repeat protein [Planctomycetota bacterium]
MALKGDLTNVNLGDIFQTLAMNLQEGVLILTHETRVKKIYFKDGKIALLGSRNRRGFRLGDRLISLGRLSPGDLNVALLQHEASGVPLGEMLVEMNLVSRKDIDETLQFQAEEEIYELFTWKDAHFEFIEGPPRERSSDNREIAEIFFNVSNVIMEAARRMDEWEVIRQDIPDLHQIFVLDRPPGPAEQAGIDWLERKVLGLIDGRRSVIDLSDETAYSTFDLAKILCELLKAGHIRPATTAELDASLHSLVKDKEYGRALKVIGKLIELSDDKVPYLRRAAELSHRTGRFEDASRFYVELARDSEHSGDLTTAEKCLKTAIKLDLRNERIHDSLLRILAARGDWDAYVEHSLKAADLAAKSGAFEHAREILERAATERPDDLQLISQLANVYIKLNRKDEAVARLQDMLAHFHPKRDRRKIEIIAEKIIKLGYRDAHLVKLLQKARQSRRSSAKRRLAVAASLIPALLLSSYLYDGYQRQRRANQLLAQAQQALESGDLWRAKSVLETLKARDPEQRYRPEWPLLEQRIREAVNRQLEAADAAKRKENEHLFQAAATRLENRDFAGAITQYLKLAEKNAVGEWRKTVESRLDALKDRLFAELDRLEKAQTAVSQRAAELGNEPALVAEYDRVLADPAKERVMELSLKLHTYKGPPDLLGRIQDLKRPVQKILALFEEVHSERQMRDEVVRRHELIVYVNEQYVAALEAFRQGRLEEVQERLERIVNSSYRDRPIEDIRKFQEEVNQIIELQRKTRRPQEIDRLEPVFQRVRHTLTQYPQLTASMRLPLQIRTTPPGAEVYLGTERLGITDPALNITYERGSPETIEIRLDGFAPLRRSLKDNQEWLWEMVLVREVKRCWSLGGPPGASPTYDGRYVFVPGRDGVVYVIDPRREEFVFQLKTQSIGGCLAEVTCADTELYFPVQEGVLHAYDRGNWKALWSAPLGSPIYAAAAVADQTVIVATKAGAVTALTRGRGEEIWTFRAGDQIRARPVVHRDRVYVAGYDRQLRALERRTGNLRWSYDAREVIDAAPAVGVNGMVFVVDSCRNLHAIDSQTGALIWKAQVGGSTAPPVIHEDSVLVASTDKVVRRLRAVDGTQIGSYQTEGTLASAPVVADGKLYQGAKDGFLWVFELTTGKRLWRFETGGPILTSPVIVDEHVLVVSSDKQVYLFQK